MTTTMQTPVSLSISPAETILEEEKMIKDETVKESTTKKSSVGDSNEKIELINPELSIKEGLSVIATTSLEKIKELEEGLLNVPELLDDSDEMLST
ncbi:unnamed protein product [Onchocerca ochengi]|uniref:Uncharacterized protein n=1 Tax=Onchocerca ochengi TaxID=42157 RepID=A0A182EVF3_ONCOC|nr:unnamed protein product [Onchocerca ochengi]